MEGWPALRRSLILRIQVVRCQALFTRAVCTVAAAGNQSKPGRRRLLLYAADRDAGKIAREGLPFCAPMVDLVRAGVACGKGDALAGDTLLARAAEGFDAADMRLWAASTRRARGLLLGGTQGQEIVRAADAVMRKEGIRDPARIAAMLAPVAAASGVSASAPPPEAT